MFHFKIIPQTAMQVPAVDSYVQGVFLFAPSNMPFATATSRRDALVSLAKVGSDAERQPPKAGENKWPAPPSPPPDTR